MKPRVCVTGALAACGDRSVSASAASAYGTAAAADDGATAPVLDVPVAGRCETALAVAVGQAAVGVAASPASVATVAGPA